jgi:hypothetical protein
VLLLDSHVGQDNRKHIGREATVKKYQGGVWYLVEVRLKCGKFKIKKEDIKWRRTGMKKLD